MGAKDTAWGKGTSLTLSLADFLDELSTLGLQQLKP